MPTIDHLLTARYLGKEFDVSSIAIGLQPCTGYGVEGVLGGCVPPLTSPPHPLTDLLLDFLP